MIITEAVIADIPAILRVRMSERENVLSDPSRATPSDCAKMIDESGKSWVCKIDGEIRGFSFAHIVQRNLWALFIEPRFERRGMGRRLHDLAVGWLFENGTQSVWLTTAPGTRAEKFYPAAGWTQSRMEPSGECRLEIDRDRWKGV